MKLTYISKFNLESDDHNTSPDIFIPDKGIEHPADSFILCRDKNGNPTAIYKNNKWDFTPYSHNSNKYEVIHFLSWTSDRNQYVQSLVDEVKWLLFILIYKVGSGRTGQISTSTLIAYYYLLRTLMVFCYQQSNKYRFIKELSINECLTNPQWLSSFIKDNKEKEHILSTLRALISHIEYLGEDETNINLGMLSIEINVPKKKKNQHPVIPTSIYINLLNTMSEALNDILPYADRLEKYITKCKDICYSKGKDTQKSYGAVKKGTNGAYRPFFLEAVKENKLEGLFISKFSCKNSRDAFEAILSIQYLVKNIIHFYTGMRDAEVLRLPFDCIQTESITPRIGTINGINDGERSINLLSTTTKFTGHRHEARWIATPEVEDAVKLAKSIAKGIAFVCDTAAKDCNLFLRPSLVNTPKERKNLSISNFTTKHNIEWFSKLTISESDYKELQATDPERNWFIEEKFKIGQPWPLSSHQFRRSLAFYARNSGSVSLPSIKRQFKHACLGMSRYYTNDFENMVTIFGRYNNKTNKYEIPNDHIINEFQTGIPLATAQMLIEDILGSDETLFGKRGGYIERIREELNNDDIYIIEVRNETEKKVKSGEIKYTETLLGGCMTVDKCDNYMLGEITACLGCDESIIKESKIDAQIEEIESTIERFDVDSGEYQIVAQELNDLKKYKKFRIKT